MASSYVNDLRLNEMATGDQSGTWGTTTNTNLELIAEAFGFGTEAITTNADTHTSTIADGATDPARAHYIKYTGTLDSACTITIAPNTINRFHIIENATSGSQNIIISQGSGSNVTIAAGTAKAVYLDGAGSGAAVTDAFSHLSVVDLTVDDDLIVTDDVTLKSDGAVLGFGADTDTTLTHTDGTGLTLNGTNKLTFGDAASFIQQSGDGVLRIDGEATIDLNASTEVNVSGLLTVGGRIVTDDTTEATSTTDGSLQTDGGLSVAKDVVIGDDLKLLSDSSVLSFGADSDITVTHVADSGLNLHSAATTGPVLQIGTTSTSVADDAVIGGVQFASGSSPTVNGRLFCKQYETDEDAGYFSNELRAPLGNALGEISREFVSQHAHGGIYIKRPMPANIFYYRDIYKSSNVSAATTTNLITINQNDYYCSIACQVHIMMLDPNYPTGAFQRIYGLAANTHQGRSSWSVKYTSLLDMGSYNQGANEIGSDNAYFNTDQTNSKSAGSNNGQLILRVTTGTFTAASCTIHLRGMFLNALFDSQTITANL